MRDIFLFRLLAVVLCLTMLMLSGAPVSQAIEDGQSDAPPPPMSKAVAPDMDTILFDRHPVDTRSASLALPARLTITRPAGPALHLIQFVGPIQQAWLDATAAAGATPIQYLANNAYLVWADVQGRSKLDALAAAGEFMQYSAPYQPAFKLGASIEKHILEAAAPDELVPVVIQIYSHPSKDVSQGVIAGLTVERLSA